ncbi:MAG: 3-hydroxyacyl-CoA dehydrogenase/enoyl-CoA hydratase family protein [Neisseriaceae bacterium]|nr:MAG: 3-hydroxyacyl-CoA dehydrogenase/enoyl-CoA hydratase family protein [Neisseriaceae bacterium]
MSKNFFIRKVAILGAGVMGTQIGAHFANAGVPVILFDLKAKDGAPNAIGDKALANLSKLKPSPVASARSFTYLSVANYDDNLDLLRECDLVIEAIAERIDWKVDLFHKITPYLNSHAIVATNTSGLSVEELASSVPESLRSRFCGIHFFNPPRYMPLVELIPSSKTEKSVLTALETFLVSGLGKSVIEAKDTPNFVANRIGVFSMMAVLEYAKKFNIPFEVVDQLTGKHLGRAKSATFRTADIVGLDTFVHVVETMVAKCKDGFENSYLVPDWLNKLIKAGALGQKTKAGIFRKDKDGIQVIDISLGDYRPADKKADPEILSIIQKKSWAEKIAALHDSNKQEAQFLWAIFRDLFHYCAVLMGEIADTPRDMDLALRWGFGWKEGIFEIWQQAGWLQVAQWIKEDIAVGKTISQKPLPEWVFKLDNGVYIDGKHYDHSIDKLVELNLLPVYDRQIFPELLLNEQIKTKQHVLYENAGVKLWHSGDNVGILSFKSKMCAIGMDVLTGLDEAIDVAEKECIALVIWQEKDVFSVGANLEEFGFSIMMNGVEAVQEIISTGQRIIANKLRYSQIPVVAGVRGYTFGGGCEIMLHCDAVVAALESYIGLIEAGVGLLPGWGGSTEMVIRAATAQDPWADLTKRYQNLALAKVATSAYEAQEMGFLRESDTIVMNTREVLLIAKERAKFMAESGYRPPIKPQVKVFGEQGIATINALLANMIAGKQISEHDLWIAKNIAEVMCGGMIDKNSIVGEDWLLNLERNKFTELAVSEKTADRIQHLLSTGKPLRN